MNSMTNVHDTLVDVHNMQSSMQAVAEVLGVYGEAGTQPIHMPHAIVRFSRAQTLQLEECLITRRGEDATEETLSQIVQEWLGVMFMAGVEYGRAGHTFDYCECGDLKANTPEELSHVWSDKEGQRRSTTSGASRNDDSAEAAE